MARILSLNVRTAFNASHTAEVPVVLCTITHSDLDGPVYLSSDPTQRLSDDPLRYGTISDGIEYNFVLMSAVLPDDQNGSPPSTQLMFENVAEDMAAVVRGFRSPASVDLKLVLASDPDTIEDQWTDLKSVRSTYDAERITLDISRQPILNEPWPAGRMTKSRFPGLFC